MKEDITAAEAAKKFATIVIENESLSSQEKAKENNKAIRNLRYRLGLMKSSKHYGELKDRTIMKYIFDARKILEKSSLCADNCKDIVIKAAKKNEIYRNKLEAIASSNDIKAAWRSELSDRSNPKGYLDTLKDLKLEHPMYYRLTKAGKHSVLKTVKANKKNNDTSHITGKNKGKKDHTGVARLSLRVVKDAIKAGFSEALIQDDKDCAVSRIILSVILCTGRRPIEILKTGTFTRKSKTSLVFGGQAKLKYGQEAEPYIIPVMFSDSDTVVAAIERIRSHGVVTGLEGLDNEAVAKRMSTTLSSCARTSLRHTNITLYTARAVYGEKAYQEYEKSWEAKKSKGLLKPDEVKLEFAGFLSDVLGHDDEGEAGVKTAQSYAGAELDSNLTPEEANEYYQASLAKQKKIKKKKSNQKHPALEKLKKLKGELVDITSHKKTLKTRLELVDFLIDACERDFEFALTASNIRRHKGGRMKPIADFLELIE